MTNTIIARVEINKMFFFFLWLDRFRIFGFITMCRNAYVLTTYRDLNRGLYKGILPIIPTKGTRNGWTRNDSAIFIYYYFWTTKIDFIEFFYDFLLSTRLIDINYRKTRKQISLETLACLLYYNDKPMIDFFFLFCFPIGYRSNGWTLCTHRDVYRHL